MNLYQKQKIKYYARILFDLALIAGWIYGIIYALNHIKIIIQ